MLGCGGGIEPLFATSYNRRTESLHNESVTYKIYPSIIKYVMDENNIENEYQLPDYVITSQQIDPMKRIKMQATWQKYVDSSISSTINLPNTATEEDIAQIYIEAWKQGLKGITVFRSGCQREAVLTVDAPKIEEDHLAPDITQGPTLRFNTGCGHLHINVSGVDGKPLKVFGNPTTGGCSASIIGLCRLASLCLRSGIVANLVIKQLSKVECNACIRNPKVNCKSCADAIGKSLQYMINNKDVKNNVGVAIKALPEPILITCKNCGEESEQSAKCFTCVHCGFSRCN